MSSTFDQMTPAERILYVQDLWDRIVPEIDQLPLTPEQAAEVAKRLAAYRADPGASIPWDVARERMRERK